MSLSKYLIGVLSALPAESQAPLATLIPPEGLLDSYDEECRDRGYVEYLVIRSAVDELIAAGFNICVDDGGTGYAVKYSTDPVLLLRAVFAVDDAYLYVFRDRKKVGWLRLIFGNDGWDVINDYTTNLKQHLTKTNELADKLGPA